MSKPSAILYVDGFNLYKGQLESRPANKALPRAGNAHRNVQRSAVGRNVALFDLTREWAYKAIRRHWGEARTTWDRAVYAHATLINETRIGNDFTTGPLSYTEVSYLAHSIATWVWQRFTPQKTSPPPKPNAENAPPTSGWRH